MDCSIPGFPVHHKLPVFTQTHVHWVRDAIQPSHVQLSPRHHPGCPHPQAELSSGSFLEESWVHETEAVLPFLPEPAGWSGLTAMRAPSSAALDSLLAAVTSDFAGIFH